MPTKIEKPFDWAYWKTTSWLKDEAEAGHELNSAHGRCIHCGSYAIDLSEDKWYGDVRRCQRK